MQMKYYHFPLTGCPLCSFQPPRKDGNSSPRDVIMGTLGEICENLFSYVRSMRTSQCRAQCVLFVSGCPLTAREQHPLFFEQCQVTYVPIEREVPLHAQCPFFLLNYRLRLYYEWVVAHEFDRFMMADVSDAVFQGDPFTPRIRTDWLYFISEEAPFGADHYAAWKWVIESINETTDPDGNFFVGKEVMNAGQIIGGREPFIILLEEEVKRLSYLGEIPCQFGWDQGVFTILLYTGFFESKNINYEVWRCTREPISFIIDFANKVRPPILGKAKVPKENDYYIYLHKFHYNHELQKSARESCPALNSFDTMPYLSWSPY